MPNGESKNWIRFLVTLESFYILHGKWPTIVHLYPFFIKELQEKLLGQDFQRLQSKIKLEPDDNNPFLALDDSGHRFDYSKEINPHNNSSVRAIEWLKIANPSYYD